MGLFDNWRQKIFLKTFRPSGRSPGWSWQDPKCWEMPNKLFCVFRKNFDNSIASNSIYQNVVADRLSVNFATSKVCPKRIWIVTKLQVIAVSCRFDVTNAMPDLREIRRCKNIWSTNMKKKSIVHPFNVTGNTKYQVQSSSLVAYRLVVCKLVKQVPMET